MTRRLLPVHILTALSLAGCIGSTVENPMKAALQGTWVGCANDGDLDVAELLTFADDAVQWTVTAFETTDGSCGGAATVARDVSGSFTVGEALQATLDGEPVVAHALDVTDATHTFYTTVYVDGDATPRTLYVGDSEPTPWLDMSSGTKRPLVLGAWKPLSEQ